jgi:hypothetical protein
LIKPRLQGRTLLIRYADDFVLVFKREADARRVMDVLPKRFGGFGLRLHPDKTRVVSFSRPTHRGVRETPLGQGASTSWGSRTTVAKAGQLADV